MRAKLKIESIQRTEHGEELKLRAVGRSDDYPEDGSDENNTYAKWTPTADLTIQVNNPDLFGKFDPGDCYYLDFTKAE